MACTTVFLAATAVADCPQLLVNSEFSTGLSPWLIEEFEPLYTTAFASVSTHEFMTLDVNVSTDVLQVVEEAALSQSGFGLVQGEQYRLSFWTRALSPSSVPARVKIGDMTTPFDEYFVRDFTILNNANAGVAHEFTFTAPVTDATSGLLIYFGAVNASLQFDSIFLEHISSPESQASRVALGRGSRQLLTGLS